MPSIPDRRAPRKTSQRRSVISMGIILFGDSGGGSLRFNDGSGKGRLILAEVGASTFDGADGAIDLDDSGLLREE